jgi:hypothetical protein
MAEKKYCVATCHLGTDFGIFLSGPDDERLTLEEAKKVPRNKDKFLFDCTADQYWEMEKKALDTGLLRCIDDAMWAEQKDPHKRFEHWDHGIKTYLLPSKNHRT